MSIETVTADGVTEVFSENEPTDRSIAWADGDPVLFVIDAWDEAGWTIVFAEDAAATPAGEPSSTPEPSATGVGP